MKKVLYFFDKLEDYIRAYLSKYPIWYALVGGVGVVLFWRGVWHTADILYNMGGIWGIIFYEPINLLLSVALLLATGLFVSFFIGDTILITGLKKEKKIAEKTEVEVKEEEEKIIELRNYVKKMKEEVDEIYADIEYVITKKCPTHVPLKDIKGEEKASESKAGNKTGNKDSK